MKILWTDGSASPNPGPGGYAVIEQKDKKARPVALGREKHTTNIRMEGSAIIAAIKYAGEEGCEIHTDSELWVNTLTKWAEDWKRNNWSRKTGAIQNLDLVKEAYELCEKYPVKFIWVRGHSGNILNEFTDGWANKARKGASVPTFPD